MEEVGPGFRKGPTLTEIMQHNILKLERGFAYKGKEVWTISAFNFLPFMLPSLSFFYPCKTCTMSSTKTFAYYLLSIIIK